jgi:CRP-like cAMP-binding protein
MISPVFIAALPYFVGLGPQEVEDIRRVVFEKTCERNEVIVMEGEPCQAVYFVAKGSVKIVKTSAEGREQVLRIMRHGDSFNDVPLFDDGPNPASALALESSVIWGISKEKVLEFLRRYPAIADNILKVFSQRLRNLMALVEDLSFRHVTSRLARMLLEYEGEAEHRLTQQEMASLVGTAREMVGRSLKDLEAMGAIKAERSRITVINRGILQQLV